MSEGNRSKRFSQNRVRNNRIDTPVYRYGIVTDRYGNETYAYSDVADFNISAMWTPITSQVEIAEYGERVNEMLQGCVFSDEEIAEKDRLLVNVGTEYLTDSEGNVLTSGSDEMLTYVNGYINGILYTVVSIKKFPHFRTLLIERVR